MAGFGATAGCADMVEKPSRSSRPLFDADCIGTDLTGAKFDEKPPNPSEGDVGDWNVV